MYREDEKGKYYPARCGKCGMVIRVDNGRQKKAAKKKAAKKKAPKKKVASKIDLSLAKEALVLLEDNDIIDPSARARARGKLREFFDQQ